MSVALRLWDFSSLKTAPGVRLDLDELLGISARFPAFTMDRMAQLDESLEPVQAHPEQAVPLETIPGEEVLAREPHRIPTFWRWFTYLLLMPLIALATAGFGTVSLVSGLWDSSGRQQHLIARVWARALLRIALSPVAVEHGKRLEDVGVAVFASNHLSYYDTPVLFAKLPFQFRILAKAPLWKIPFIGWYLQRSGQVPIDQSSTRAGVISLGQGVKTLQAGLPLVIFPEGGRTADGAMQPMAAGAAWMAIKAGVPLVPLTLIGTYELLPIHVYALRPRPLKLVVGEPISTIGMTTKDAERLTEQLRMEIHDAYVAAQSEL